MNAIYDWKPVMRLFAFRWMRIRSCVLVSLHVFLSPCMFVLLLCLYVREHEEPIAWSTGCFAFSGHSRIVLNRHRVMCIHVGWLVRERSLPVSV